MNLKAKSYTTTLWELLKTKSLEEVNFVLDVLQILTRLYEINDDFKTWINHPLISTPEKETQLRSFFQNGEIDDSLVRFIQLLVENKYFDSFSTIIRRLKIMRNEHFHFLPVKVTVQKPLTNEQKINLEENLKRSFKADIVSIQEKIDQNILGGMILESEDLKIDRTLRHRIEKIEEKLAI